MKTTPNIGAEKFYTEIVDQKMGEDYEEARWHKNSRAHALYEMTKTSIRTLLLHKKNSHFESCLELGPGAGTWTREVVEAQSSAEYDFVDISGVMLEKTKKVVGEYNLKARFFVSEFNLFVPDRTYKLFFSIRAFEYIEEKEQAVTHIMKLLEREGSGFVITKTPHYARARVAGRRYSSLHTGQITPEEFKGLCLNAGFTDVEMYPVTFTFPLLKSPRLDMFLYRLFAHKKINFISQFFSESYVIMFTKA